MGAGPLSVLGDVSQGFSMSGFATRRHEVLNAPRQIYVAFGEHPAAGGCVCVCSSKLVVLLLGRVLVGLPVCIYSFARVFVWLFVDSFLSVFLWLVVCCVLVCLLTPCGTFSCLPNTLEDFIVSFLHFGAH